MRTILLSILILCLVSCEQATNTDLQNGQILQAARQPIKTAKKRNCANKQTFEGARGGIFHYDTSRAGNVYKHYVKQ